MSRMRVALLVPDPGFPEPYAWTYDVEAAILKQVGIEVTPVAALTEGPSAFSVAGDVVPVDSQPAGAGTSERKVLRPALG